jgi:UDP-glucose:(heptosyl)LPS alpha-1,3-glucosyltransferase
MGCGDRPLFEALADEVGAAARVHFLGRRTDTERYYAAADLFVLPSLYEGMSLAALEAAASGLPLIMGPCPGAAELIREGINGWVISLDGAEIAERIGLLAASPTLRAEMGGQSRAIAESYGWDRVVRSYLSRYEACARN